MYKQIIDQIFKAYPMYHKIGSAAYKEGLENIEALLSILGNPERQLKTVHIAGTNGKGSVAHLMASYCQERGYKTGLFTSPHLIDFRERIKIDGEMITEQQVIDFFLQFQKEFTRIEPSFFEMTTALAFYYFAQQHVDVAVVEVGLGGRLDATNVLTPLMSIITNISLEHTQLLGSTMAKIAYEKAGIIKPDVPVVIGEFHPETFPVFTDLANLKNAPLFLADANYRIIGPLNDATVADVQGNVLYEHVRMPVGGEYQRKNLITFLQAADVFQQIAPADRNVVVPAIEHLLSNTNMVGRWQILREHPLTICDVGHNVGGLSLTMTQLTALPCRKLHIVFGMVKDKDVAHVLPLLPQNADYYICQAAIERAIPADELAGMFQTAGLHCRVFPSVETAFEAAEQIANPDDVVFVGGSCFVVGDLLTVLSENGL